MAMILAASKCQNHSSTLDHPTELSELLSTTTTISRIWRTSKYRAIGSDIYLFWLLESPEITQDHRMPMLQTRECEKRLQEIRDATKAKKLLCPFSKRSEVDYEHQEEQQ